MVVVCTLLSMVGRDCSGGGVYSPFNGRLGLLVVVVCTLLSRGR